MSSCDCVTHEARVTAAMYMSSSVMVIAFETMQPRPTPGKMYLRGQQIIGKAIMSWHVCAGDK